MNTATTAIWRRLDVPGHDACRLESRDDGWELKGTAVFADPAGPGHVEYQLHGLPGWIFTRGIVRGWIGAREISYDVRRSPQGEWTLNGRRFPEVDGYSDLDLGFTPSTNLLHLRRANLRVGESRDIPVAWADAPKPLLTPLPQHYERRAENAYWYESPTAGYSAMLIMSESGFVAEYPGLWRLETEET